MAMRPAIRTSGIESGFNPRVAPRSRFSGRHRIASPGGKAAASGRRRPDSRAVGLCTVAMAGIVLLVLALWGMGAGTVVLLILALACILVALYAWASKRRIERLLDQMVVKGRELGSRNST